MTSLANNFLRLAVFAALIGVSLGYWMGSTDNFTAAPVHAHLNLLGWVSMFLYGLFYKAHPEAARGWLPTSHFWVNVAGVVIFMPALAAYLLHVPGLEAAAQIGLIVGPTLVLLSMAMFFAIVFKATGSRPTAA